MCGIIRTFAHKKEIVMSLMGLPLWAWIIFYVLVLLMLVADLKMFGKKGQHEVNVKEALQMTAVSLAGRLVLTIVFFGVLVLSMLLSVAVTRRKS